MGVAGGEQDVRALILEKIADRVSDVTIDPMGNVTARHKGTGASLLRVMISAHMDEIGFMIRSVDDDGLIHVVPIGAHDLRLIPTQRVLVGDAKTPGVFLWVPIHKSHGKNDFQEIDDMLIDIGAENKAGVHAQPGERIAYAGHCIEMSPGVMRGKAFDSRAGCAALIDLLSGDPFPFDVSVAFTAQATIGGRGAAVAANRLDPQVAFTLSAVVCNEWPHDPEYDHAPLIRLGGGPVLSALESDLVADRRLIAHVQKVAKAENIPIQFNALAQRSGANTAVGFARAGVPTLTLGVPVRYLGSPNALLQMSDLNQLLTLVRASLTALTPDLLENK